MSPDPPVRVFILADVRLYREGLAQALAQFDALEVVGCAPADQDGFEAVSARSAAVVLIDASTIHDGAAVNEASEGSGARVVACGVVGRDDEVVRCAHAGVAGYVTREASLEELVATVLTVAQGDVACPSRIAAILLRRLSSGATIDSASRPGVYLTLRERQIVSLLDQGLSNKEIATRLGLEVSTVKNHVHHTLEKLGAKRRGEGAWRARRTLQGWRSVSSISRMGLLACLGAAMSLAMACNEPTPLLPCTTTLGGRCWVYLGPDDAMVLAVAEVHGELWIGTTSRGRSGLLRYDAAGRVWRHVAFPGKTVRSIVADAASGAVWATVNGAYPDTTFSYLYRTMNRGKTWEPRDGGFAAQQHFYSDAGPFAIDPANRNHILLGIPGGVALSEDGTATWERVLGLKDTMFATTLAYDAVAISPADGRRVWAGGTNLLFGEQMALRSDDGGHTWREISRPGPPRHGTVPVLLPHPQNPDVVLASVWRSLQVTSDGGATWRTVLELTRPGRYVHAFVATSAVLVAVSDEWVSDLMPGVLGVYTATAHEGPWTAVPAPPDAASGWSVTLDHQGQIVIGTERGVWLVREGVTRSSPPMSRY